MSTEQNDRPTNRSIVRAAKENDNETPMRRLTLDLDRGVRDARETVEKSRRARHDPGDRDPTETIETRPSEHGRNMVEIRSRSGRDPVEIWSIYN
nr:MAG: hypothetical protein [Apis mellifera filamentous virus]